MTMTINSFKNPPMFDPKVKKHLLFLQDTARDTAMASDAKDLAMAEK